METYATPMSGKPVRNYLTIKQTARRYAGVFETEGALRNLIWKAEDRYSSQGVIKGNGLASAIIRIGRKIVLDEEKLVAWIESHKAESSNND